MIDMMAADMLKHLIGDEAFDQWWKQESKEAHPEFYSRWVRATVNTYLLKRFGPLTADILSSTADALMAHFGSSTMMVVANDAPELEEWLEKNKPERPVGVFTHLEG